MSEEKVRYCFHEFHCGLGDVISQNFLDVNYGKPNLVARRFKKMIELHRSNYFREVGVVNHSNNPIAAAQLVAPLGIPVWTPAHAEELKAVSSATLEPAEDVIPFPLVQPDVWIPRKYILFNQLSASEERNIDSPEHYRIIKESTNLPIIKVGRGISTIPCDIDLTNLTTVPETAWLAKHAVCVVSAITFHRCWAGMFRTPVLEIAEPRASDLIINKTIFEYAHYEYGMLHEKDKEWNRWLKYPLQEAEYRELLKFHVKEHFDLPRT